jgi:DNA topoisomerase III
MVLDKNYLEVYIYERWSDMEIPVYQVGEQFVPTTLDLKDGETAPPNLLTEPELISLMEKHGIGKHPVPFPVCGIKRKNKIKI